ncbi:hypothetical protein NQZ68_010669 [Dissostichus eleginoides]|nr:hypothetical protein NQZ68_010669 [Dissostichus eleginoides]
MADTAVEKTVTAEVTAKELKEKKEVEAKEVEKEKKTDNGDAPANGTVSRGPASWPFVFAPLIMQVSLHPPPILFSCSPSTQCFNGADHSDKAEDKAEDKSEKKAEDKAEDKAEEKHKNGNGEAKEAPPAEETDAPPVKRAAEEEEEKVETKKQKTEENGASKEAEVKA